jgi:retinol dehydrogenase-12
LHATELNRRYASKNVIGVSLHPGMIGDTNLYNDLGVSAYMSSFVAANRTLGIWSVLKEMRNDPGKKMDASASTSLVAALDPDVVPGGYYADCQIETERRHPAVLDEGIAKKLWEVTEKIISERISK